MGHLKCFRCSDFPKSFINPLVVTSAGWLCKTGQTVTCANLLGHKSRWGVIQGGPLCPAERAPGAGCLLLGRVTKVSCADP